MKLSIYDNRYMAIYTDWSYLSVYIFCEKRNAIAKYVSRGNCGVVQIAHHCVPLFMMHISFPFFGEKVMRSFFFKEIVFLEIVAIAVERALVKLDVNC